MREIVAADQPFVRDELGRDDGRRAIFADQPYKVEIIEKVDPPTRRRSVTGTDDLACTATRARRRPSSSTSAAARTCRPPSGSARSSSRRSRARTGAATSKRPMLQRIYGTAWESKAALEEHLHRLEEAERRDHRQLGAELDLFSFPEEIGSGPGGVPPEGRRSSARSMEDYSRARARGRGLRVRELAAHHEGEPVRDVRAPRLVRRRHVPADGARRADDGARTTSSR